MHKVRGVRTEPVHPVSAPSLSSPHRGPIPFPIRPHIPGNRKTCSLKATTQPSFLSEQQRRMLFVNALFIYGLQKNMPPQGILNALSLNVNPSHTKAGVVSAFHHWGWQLLTWHHRPACAWGGRRTRDKQPLYGVMGAPIQSCWILP